MSEKELVRTLKCVFVGEEAAGKTSLIVSYTTNGYRSEYIPTLFDNYSVVVLVDNRPIRVQLCDTAGQTNLNGIRPLSYPDCDVFIVVYSVVDVKSYHNITDRWLPEITKVSPNTPVILVGTQIDRRWSVPSAKSISTTKGKALANQIKASDFFECSALTQDNLKQMFDSAILAGLESRRGVTSKKSHSSKLKQGFQRFMNITRKVF